jgi:hypothetical protein
LKRYRDFTSLACLLTGRPFQRPSWLKPTPEAAADIDDLYIRSFDGQNWSPENSAPQGVARALRLALEKAEIQLTANRTKKEFE